MFRFYFFADNTSTMYVCPTDQQTCITENKFTLKSQSNTTLAKKLPIMADYFIIVETSQSKYFDLMMHTAVELSQDYDFKSSP